MSNAVLTEFRHVAKRQTKPPEPDPPIGRIELQAEPEFIARLDAAARAVGLSRSAYIRLACHRLMMEDARTRPPYLPPQE